MLKDAVAKLRDAGIDTAKRDAKKLWDQADGDAQEFAVFIERRVAREPVSQIIGKRAFWEHEFIVTSDVLDPRPDTETLVEAALQLEFTNILDLGTGSGCILLSLLAARPQARGVGTDISIAALDVARRNAKALDVQDRAEFLQSDWYDAVNGQFDLIVSNPPYITSEDYATLAPELLKFEPKTALTPGEDGLDAYRSIAAHSTEYLAPNGHLLVEIGYDQGSAVFTLFDAAGLENIRVLPDLNGKDRVIAAQNTQNT